MSQGNDTDPKAPYGHGTIDARPNGRYRIRLMLKNGSRRSVTYSSLEEATRMRDALLLELADADESPTGALTFGAYGETWLTARENSGAYRSVANERSAWNVHISKSDLAAKPLVDVSRRDVREFVARLAAKKALKQRGPKSGKPTDRAPVKTTRTLSTQSIMHVLKLVRGVLSTARDEELVRENVALGVKLPKRRATVGETWLYLTPAEIDRLLTCPTIAEATRCMYTVAVYAGLRQGELWSLRWTDIRLDGPRPEIHVQRSHDGPPKNGKSRHVPLLPPALAALRRLVELQPKRFEAQGLVFPTGAGNRRRKCDDGGWRGRSLGVKRPRPGHRDHAGIARPVRFHDIRHTCASHLLMGTWGRVWTLPEVRDFLGHSSVSQTQRYAHLSPDHLASAAAATAGPTLVLNTGPEGLNPAKPHAEAVGQEGGTGQFAHVALSVEPGERGSGLVFTDDTVGGVIPKGYIPAIEKGVRGAMERGVATGHPMVDVRVRLRDGSFHKVDSSGPAFEIAGSRAFQEAAKSAGIVGLEPVMSVEVTVPEDFIGEAVASVQSRRGTVRDLRSLGSLRVIDATVPLARLFGYVTELRSRTQGRGSAVMAFSHYDET